MGARERRERGKKIKSYGESLFVVEEGEGWLWWRRRRRRRGLTITQHRRIGQNRRIKWDPGDLLRRLRWDWRRENIK